MELNEMYCPCTKCKVEMIPTKDKGKDSQYIRYGYLQNESYTIYECPVCKKKIKYFE